MTSLAQLKTEKVRLDREIQRRTRKVGQIQSRINQHQKKIARLQAQFKMVIGAETAKAPVKKTKKARKAVKKMADRKPAVPKMLIRKAPKVAKKQSLTRKQLVIRALSESEKPLNISEIISVLKAKHYSFKAKNPRNGLTVLLYTDKTFQKTKPGYFTVKK